MSTRHIWLLLALLGSAIAVVMTQHQARKLEVERTELQLEQSTLSAHGRVEAVARERLGMAIPVGPQVQALPEPATVAATAPGTAP